MATGRPKRGGAGAFALSEQVADRTMRNQVPQVEEWFDAGHAAVVLALGLALAAALAVADGCRRLGRALRKESER